MKKRTQTTLGQPAHLLLLALSLTLTACGGGGAKTTAAETVVSSYDRGYYEGDMAPAAAMEAPAFDSSYYDDGSFSEGSGIPMYSNMMAETAAAAREAFPETEAAMAAPQEGAADTGASSGVTQTTASDPALPMDRKLIRNIDLRVETTSFDDLLASIQTKVGQLEGYTEQSDISGNSITQMGRPSKKYASMVLRIPADKLNTFISYVETDGNVTYRSENVSDVTLQYSDMESRLKTLRMEQDRLWELLAKADTTESIVLLEERLTEVLSEIEEIGSRLRHMDNSVTYSTVYLEITEVDLESPTEPETPWQQVKRGFARNVSDLGDALTAFFIGLLSNSPTYLFLLLLLFAAYRLIRLFLRRGRQAPEGAKKAEWKRFRLPAKKGSAATAADADKKQEGTVGQGQGQSHPADGDKAD